MFVILNTILLFVIFGNLVYDCSEVIGNYTNVKAINHKSCGISLFSSELKGCFKYHNDLPLNMKDSRNALPGEAPWSVFKVPRSRCLGALITDRWVMTAAHCLLSRNGTIGKNPIMVFIPPVSRDWNGTEYMSSDERHIHPNFTTNGNKSGSAYDIGLFKLEKPIVMRPGFVNTICLPPERNFTYFDDQYAMVTGWEYKGFSGNSTLIRQQIGIIKVSSHINFKPLHKHFVYPFDVVKGNYFIWPGYIFGSKIDDTKSCKGDSGAPVWQYYHGRAVLIGILSRGDPDLSDPNGCQKESYTGYFPNDTSVENLTETQYWITWVPMMMDWVKSVITNDTQIY